MNRIYKKTLLSIASSFLIALSALSTSVYAGNGDTLKTVKDRGRLLCSGHNGSFPPFVTVTDDNKWSGYDIDYCRALTVAIFGSDSNLKVVPVSWAQRFPSLQSGDLDIVIKATGWTMGRDTEMGIQFSRPYFVGATNVMMPRNLGSTAPLVIIQTLKPLIERLQSQFGADRLMGLDILADNYINTELS